MARLTQQPQEATEVIMLVSLLAVSALAFIADDGESELLSPVVLRQLDHLRELARVIERGSPETFPVFTPKRDSEEASWLKGEEAFFGRELALLEQAVFAREADVPGQLAELAAAQHHVSEWAGDRASGTLELQPGEYETLAVVVENRGAVDLVDPVLSVNHRDWTTIEALADAAAGGATQPAQIALNLWRFLVLNRRHEQPASESIECHDPVKLLNVYGYGLCDDAANVFTNMASELGLDARVWALDGHVVPEVFYDDAWHVFDPDHEAYYLDSSGAVASLAQLEASPDLLNRPVRLPDIPPRNVNRGHVRGIVGSASDNRVAPYPVPREYHRMRYVLRPGERVSLFRGHRGYRFAARRYRVAQEFANGMWEHSWGSETAPSEGFRSCRYALPWPILGGSLVVRAESLSAPSTWSLIARDAEGGERTLENPTAIEGGWLFDLDLIAQRGTGEPDYSLEFELHGIDPALARAEVDVTLMFQHAPRALPVFREGNNTLEWRSADGSARVTHVLRRH